MYIPVWLLVLVVAPWLLYVAFGGLMLLGMHVLLGIAKLVDTLSAGLGIVLTPAKPLGPWFDYVAATAVLAGLVCITALLA